MNAVDVSHRTPLLAACYSGQPNCAALLLASGADLAIADKAGFSPLQMAAQEGNIECIELLVGHGASADSISVLVAHHHVTGEAQFATWRPLCCWQCNTVRSTQWTF